MSKFDGAFESLLQQTIEADLTVPIFMDEPLEEGKLAQLIESDKVRNFIGAFNRITLNFLLELSGIDILSCDLKDVRNQGSCLQKFKEFFMPRSQSKKPSKSWPRILLAVWFGSFVLVLISTYHQYIYDANSFKLRKLDEYVGDSTRENGSLNHSATDIYQLRTEFETSARQSREVLDALGVAHVEWSFLIESLLVIFTIFPMVVNRLIVSPLVWLKKPWLPLSLIALLDRHKESQLRTTMTMMELNRFTRNSLTFAMTKLEQLNKDLTQTIADSHMSQREQLERLRHEALTKFALRLRERHLTTIMQLKRIALAGGLNPLNRTPACRDQLALWNFITCVGTYLYMNVLIGIGYIFFHRHHSAKGVPIEHNTLKKFANSLDLFAITQFGALAALLHLVMVSVIVQDHLVLVGRLRTIVVRTIKSNGYNFERLAQMDHSDSRANRSKQILSEQIELDLLTLIIQSRLFLKSYALALTPLNMIAHVLLPFPIFVQLVLKVHSAYFDSDLASVSTSLGFAVAIALLMFLFPLGRLHQSCIRTFHAYWTLVAQMSHFEQNDNINRSSIMQMSVAVFTFRRELADSRQTNDKFACRMLSIRITNSNNIRIAFWTLVLIVSLSGKINLFGESLTRFMRDPFGLLRFAHDFSN